MLVYNYESHQGPATYFFEEKRQAEGYSVVSRDFWTTERSELTKRPGSDYFDHGKSGGKEEVVVGEDYVEHLFYDFYSHSVYSNVTARTLDRAKEVIERTRLEYPPREEESDKIPIHFWTMTGRGPINRYREIVAQPWEEISRNYPSQVREKLEPLFNDYQPNIEGGKLLLAYGIPGTGKTHWLRSLAREWSEWAEIHYIMDPDQFFGGQADYLFEVLMTQSENDKWRLVVCEDTGELLAADAKVQTGQALSRFLNVCDGLVGQGLKFQVLISTNDELRNFHEAVTRPGRLAADLPFTAFPRNEAARWLGEPVDSELSLAELYALKNGTAIKKKQRAGIV